MADNDNEDTRDIVVGRQDAKPQRRRWPSSKRFSPRKRQRFLDALAYSCNVQLSAEHAGVVSATVYAHRSRDPLFAAQWRDALAVGYDRLEALVLEHGGAGQALAPADPDRADAAALPPFDFDRALKVLAQYRAVRDGQSRQHNRFRGITATRDETNEALLKALAAARKRLAKRAPGQ